MILQLREQICKNRGNHTPVPEGYMQWDAWATRMSKTHRQTRCPECGLWAIWIKKVKKTRVTSTVRSKEQP